MTLRFAFWFTICCVAMPSICFAQNKPSMGRPAEITFATGKTVSSPRVWFDAAAYCSTERNQYIQQSLTVKMASGVEAGLAFSGVSRIEVTPAAPGARITGPNDDYTVAVQAPNKPLLTGKPWSFSGVCVVLPSDETARIKAEFPAGLEYPENQCIFDLKSEAFASLKSLGCATD